MASLAELIDHGTKAFTRGLHADAERYWREALELDPGNGARIKPGRITVMWHAWLRYWLDFPSRSAG